MTHFSVKVTHNGTIRRFQLPVDVSYDALLNELSGLFNVTRPFTVLYRDPEDDLIMLSSGVEFEELMRLVKQDLSAVVKITISDNKNGAAPSRSTEAPPQSSQAPPQPSQTPPQRDSQQHSRGNPGPSSSSAQHPFIQFIEEMMRMASSTSGRGFGMGDMGDMGMNFGGMFPFMMPSFTEIPTFSDETKQTFYAARTAAMESETDHKEILSAVLKFLPALLDSISNALPEQEGAPLADAAITDMANSVRTSLESSRMPEALATAIGTLVRTGLKDPAVVNMLRQFPLQAIRSTLQRMGSNVDMDIGIGFGGPHMCGAGMPFGEMFGGHYGGRRHGGRRFGGPGGRHGHGRGHGRGHGPGHGHGFGHGRGPHGYSGFGWGPGASDWNPFQQRSGDGQTSDENEFPWSSEFRGEAAPPAPLMPGDHGVKVLFLQKVLTDLGYMTGDMYARRAGVYGPNTKAAVARFQKEFGLESATTEGVYDATTAASLASIVESGTECRRAADQGSAGAGPASKGPADSGGPSNVST